MQLRQPQLADGVKWRREPFGSVVYVPYWDSFFALDHEHTRQLLGGSPSASPDGLGLPGLVGDFASMPVGDRPLLVNCFATAHCPLQCAYCYADDLMMSGRSKTEDDLVPRVLAMADALDAMVAVVTGGEPLARPRQSAELITKLATTKAVVVDSSGVGDIYALMPALIEARAHLRVSIDSADPGVNDAQRPIRKPFQIEGISSLHLAVRTLDAAASEGIPVSVQTVLTAASASVDQLARLRDLLVGLGVRKWVLHVVATAGRARKHSSSPRSAQPGDAFASELRAFVADTIRQRYPLLIRVTDSNQAPNSVLLIDSQGSLLTEGTSGTGKIVLGRRGDDRSALADAIDRELDLAGHYSRYLNCDVLPGPGR